MEYIFNGIKSYIDSSPIRLHMPGHKGYNICDFKDNVFGYDVTELDATDNLYSPKSDGFVQKQLDFISSIFSSHASIISCGGATLCLQSALYCAKKHFSSPFLVNVNCHKSVINALSLIRADVTFFTDDFDIEQLLKKEKYTVVLTSPDYYGRMYDIKYYSSLCKKYSSHLVVDNSHGSHLAFSDECLHPNRLGADLTVDSLHKTLPVLTGGALLHSCCEISTDDMLRGLRIFGSTSPSYLIACSVSSGIEYMHKNGQQALNDLKENLNAFVFSLSDTDFYRVTFPISDPYRLVISSKSGIDMHEADKFLAKNNIYSEFSDESNLILIPSIMNTSEDFARLSATLSEFPVSTGAKELNPVLSPFDGCFKPEKTLGDVMFSNVEKISVSECIGRLSAEMKYSYPPGIPYILPGVRINEKMRNIMLKNGEKYISAVTE